MNVGFLEHELDALIDAVAEAGGHTESKAQNRKAAWTTHVFLTDAERRNRLRAQVTRRR